MINKGVKQMRMYQNEKQRKCSEDIERRFPTIQNPAIRSVYLETQKLPESSNHYQNTYSKNAFVMKRRKSSSSCVVWKICYNLLRSSSEDVNPLRI